MSTTPSKSHAQPQSNSEAERMRYVEELAGPEDAWVSITDAARITRTSEAMARRWVTSGRLPVKRQPVGLNQQTRLVRLSDIATIRPIIDPAAAISDEIHKLDLPSIPRQQAHIMQEHERLLRQVQEGQRAVNELRTVLLELATKQQQEVGELGHRFSTHQDELQGTLKLHQQQQETLARQVYDQAQRIAQGESALAEHKEQHQRDLQQLRTSLMSQLKEARAETERMFDALDQEYRRQSEQMRRDLTTLLQQQEERVQRMFLSLTALQQALVRHREELTILTEQQAYAVKTSLEQQASDHRRDVVALREHLEKIEQRLEQVGAGTEAVSTAIQGYQKRADAQEQAISTLTEVLQGERTARKALAEHLAAQQEQVQVLRREIESLKARKTEPSPPSSVDTMKEWQSKEAF